MSDRRDGHGPVERVNEGPRWAGLVVVAGAAAFLAMAWVVVGYGLRVRDGSGELACAVTTCTPVALTLSGLATALFPAVWCALFAVCYRRLNTLLRRLGAGFTVLLLAFGLFYLPDGEAVATTGPGEQFGHGMALGFFALFVDLVILAPVLVWVWQKRGRPALWVWLVLFGVPVAFVTLAAVTNP
ncbi:hypothetical protein [Actinoplanes utahensis]|uniref:hypothetical protein n=1 Tax=Actinoplanes utahensis TaxID=1869 RepID=UPI000AB30916|nr:hypothetical protein [Actinoplanes utahensis]GIF30200.1 hypothetical protein Aut01nite_31860 [Actinoplanes utahensis]